MESLCILKSKNRLSFHKGSVQIFQEEDFEKANPFGNPNSVMQPTVFQGSICIKFFVILSIKLYFSCCRHKFQIQNLKCLCLPNVYPPGVLALQGLPAFFISRFARLVHPNVYPA